MSFDEKWSWNPDTPARLPAGARISAGKSGKVAMSLPAMAAALVNSVPVSCMPSPESPTNRMTTFSISFTCGLLGEVDISVAKLREAEGLGNTRGARGLPRRGPRGYTVSYTHLRAHETG